MSNGIKGNSKQRRQARKMFARIGAEMHNTPSPKPRSQRAAKFRLDYTLALVGCGLTVMALLLPPNSPATALFWLAALVLTFSYPSIHLSQWLLRSSGRHTYAIALVLLLAGVAAFGWRIWPVDPILVKVTFKSSPLLTDKRKTEITKSLNDFYLYFSKMGFEVPKEVPPVGAAKGWLIGGTANAGGVYNAQMIIPEESLDDSREMISRAYSHYLISFIVPENPVNIYQSRVSGQAISLLSDYYSGSFLGHRVKEQFPEVDVWSSTLWELREKYGQEFMDKSVFFAIKRWTPYGSFPRDDTDFDKYFAARIEVGASVFDDNGTPSNDIHKIFQKNIFGRHLAAIVVLSDDMIDGHSLELDFGAHDDVNRLNELETNWVNRVSGDLEKYLDAPHVNQFRAAKFITSGKSSFPAGLSNKGKMIWQDIEAKMAKLDSFVTELRAANNP